MDDGLCIDILLGPSGRTSAAYRLVFPGKWIPTWKPFPQYIVAFPTDNIMTALC